MSPDRFQQTFQPQLNGLATRTLPSGQFSPCPSDTPFARPGGGLERRLTIPEAIPLAKLTFCSQGNGSCKERRLPSLPCLQDREGCQGFGHHSSGGHVKTDKLLLTHRAECRQDMKQDFLQVIDAELSFPTCLQKVPSVHARNFLLLNIF